DGRRRCMTALARIAVLALLAGGCAAMQSAPSNTTAKAELKNASGQTVGTATLSQRASGVQVVLEMRGMPAGAHGVHVHEVGTCDPPGFTTAGGHFNPGGKKHGTLSA